MVARAGAKIAVVYADWDRVARDVRLDVVLEGRFTGEPGGYSVIAWAARLPGEPDTALCDRVWMALNDDDRPGGTLHRSMSVGDGLLLPDGGLLVAQSPTGWKRHDTARAFRDALRVEPFAYDL